MRKSDLEKARNSFMSTGATTSQLRNKITRDLSPIRNAYEIAVGAWDQVEVLMQSVTRDEKPTKALRELAAAMKDLQAVMVGFRTEARETAQYHVAQETKEPLDSPPKEPSSLPSHEESAALQAADLESE